MTVEAPRHPLPPFTTERAIEKVRLAEDGWNGRKPIGCSVGRWGAALTITQA